jgi:hypothetical protein
MDAPAGAKLKFNVVVAPPITVALWVRALYPVALAVTL